MSTFRTNSGLRRAAGVVVLGALVLGGTFATAAAFNGRGSSIEEDTCLPGAEPRPGRHACARSHPGPDR